jgi:hypothetical protein
MTNWERFGMMHSWSNRGTVPEYAWRNIMISLSQDRWYPTQDSKQTPPKCEARTFVLHQPAQLKKNKRKRKTCAVDKVWLFPSVVHL